MRLSSVRELKASLVRTPDSGFAMAVREIAPFGVAARRVSDVQKVQPSIALGVAPGKAAKDFRLAIRVQHRQLLKSDYVNKLMDSARGEADVRFIGTLAKRGDGNRSRQRPLRPGTSVGHFRITAGTIGCLVERGRQTLILSNNHVLADENAGQVGDAILQPGAYDGGRQPRDVIGELVATVDLLVGKSNRMDCAVASIAGTVEFDPVPIGMRSHLHADLADPEEGGRVEKVGRTTGRTRGRVTAFEVDDVVVRYDLGNVRFDGQIEIAGGRQPFSAGGDSGSLIFTSGDRRPYALLFAGSDVGGPSGSGVTYGSPMRPVLQRLKSKLVV